MSILAGFRFISKRAKIAFLEEQLAAAIDLIHKKDATEAACIERVTAVYVPIQERLKRELEATKKSLERERELLRTSALRYTILRSVPVRAMQLGIDNLSGEALDRALDQHAEAKKKAA